MSIVKLFHPPMASACTSIVYSAANANTPAPMAPPTRHGPEVCTPAVLVDVLLVVVEFAVTVTVTGRVDVLLSVLMTLTA